jgi:hypothetical protein
MEVTMPFVVGTVLALGVAVFARRCGLDRDRAFYPTVLIVVASYYLLFAAISGSTTVLLVESVVAVAFITAAVRGFKASPWIVAAALVGHGLFDVVHGEFIHNSGMPPWWPAFCAAYDVGAGICLAWILVLHPPEVAERSGLAGLSLR